MAGVNTVGDEGVPAGVQAVPAIGGADYRAVNGLPTTVNVAKSAHLTDAQQQDGVHYQETPGMAVTNHGYPVGTDNGEGNNPLRA